VQALRSGDAAARLRALRDIKNQVIGAQNKPPLAPPRICSHLPLRRRAVPRLTRTAATLLRPCRLRRRPARGLRCADSACRSAADSVLFQATSTRSWRISPSAQCRSWWTSWPPAARATRRWQRRALQPCAGALLLSRRRLVRRLRSPRAPHANAAPHAPLSRPRFVRQPRHGRRGGR
jgi:hypothetical protein